MEKEVRVYIKGNQYIENGEASEESTVEETAVGKLYDRNGKLYVTFEEMTEEEMREYISGHIARHKMPRYIDFTDSFPRSMI